MLLAFDSVTRGEVKFHAYYGSTGQEMVYVDRAVFDRICLELGCETLASFTDLDGKAGRVVKGERSVLVPAYVKKTWSGCDPISGESELRVSYSPRTIRLFAR